MFKITKNQFWWRFWFPESSTEMTQSITHLESHAKQIGRHRFWHSSASAEVDFWEDCTRPIFLQSYCCRVRLCRRMLASIYFWVFGFWFLVFGFWFSIFWFWFLVFGFRFFDFWVFGFWIFVSRFFLWWSLVFGFFAIRFVIEFSLQIQQRHKIILHDWRTMGFVNNNGFFFIRTWRSKFRIPSHFSVILFDTTKHVCTFFDGFRAEAFRTSWNFFLKSRCMFLLSRIPK